MDITHSADGTAIAYERTGDGRPVVLIGGAFNDRSTVGGLAAALEIPTVVYDRRGRGDSGPVGPELDIAREVADLAAVIDATGGEADLFGHSSGAALAIEAVLAGLPVRRLAVYEPPYLVDDTRERPADLAARLQALVALKRPADAATLFLVEGTNTPAEVVAGMSQDPGTWGWLTGLAHTLPHDAAFFAKDQSIPDPERFTTITVPTLAIAGGASPAWLQAGAAEVATLVPGARHVTMPGYDHAVLQQPVELAGILAEFYR
jgi:pimeloyl-ACP methyl ester carboxylesterase